MPDAVPQLVPPRPAVIPPESAPWKPLGEGDGSVSVRIDHTVGATNLVQRVVELPAGGRQTQHHPVSEDVSYVVTGAGSVRYGDTEIELHPGVGFRVPSLKTYEITASSPLRLVSVLAPSPEGPQSLAASPDADPDTRPWVHESEQEVIPAGDDETRERMDRYFKLMMDPRHGARYVTQFIGFIERSKAADHTHTYDEAIYIIGGEGVVHIDAGPHPISSGYSVYLPPGSVHCLENPGDIPLSLLGVFCPAGSPRERQEA